MQQSVIKAVFDNCYSFLKNYRHLKVKLKSHRYLFYHPAYRCPNSLSILSQPTFENTPLSISVLLEVVPRCRR